MAEQQQLPAAPAPAAAGHGGAAAAAAAAPAQDGRQQRAWHTAKQGHSCPLARVSLVCLAAPSDGVAPSLLLSVQDAGRRQLGQYLFNAPEGLSRLVLEHRARPERCLAALFLSGPSPAEAGGLGGLLLRLKQDGHAALQLVGPQGGARARGATHALGCGCRACHIGCPPASFATSTRDDMTLN